jgi:hypothetical protein
MRMLLKNNLVTACNKLLDCQQHRLFSRTCMILFALRNAITDEVDDTKAGSAAYSITWSII